MSSISFDNYERIANRQDAEDIEIAGRYRFQSVAERRIIGDVATKLALDSDDTLLEIGCGPGNLLLPLSHSVSRAAAIDNATALARLVARCGSRCSIDTYTGNFLKMTLPDLRFDKILIYSVIQYVDSKALAIAFLRRALSLLRPGGRLLIGDLPNQDKKTRFMKSAAGEKAGLEWKLLLTDAGAHPLTEQPQDSSLLTVDDDLLLTLARVAREDGYESYILCQPRNLPFGNTREDLLFVAPA